MKTIVLFRKSLSEEGEFDVCRKYFSTIEYRSELSFIRDNNKAEYLIIPRYSALPYFQELERDINNLGGRLINSYQQHKWIANFEWYEPLKQFTPKTYFDYNFFSAPNDQQYVVKGATNSRKNQWNTMMFAQNKQDALRIAADLKNDGLICNQDIIYREYVPLKVFEYGINGLPFSDEWRFFFYKDQRLSHGYYWQISDYIPNEINTQLEDFTEMLSSIVKNYVNFFVLDVAMTEKEEPILIEINDGCCSGLSECSADELYYNLKKALL